MADRATRELVAEIRRKRAEDGIQSENMGHLRLVKNEPPALPPYELDTEEQYPEPSEGHRHFEIVTCRDCGAYLGDVEP